MHVVMFDIAEQRDIGRFYCNVITNKEQNLQFSYTNSVIEFNCSW